MKLWIGNVAPNTTDDEVRDLIKKYAPDLESSRIVRVEGDGSRPAVVVEFADPPFGALEKVSMRLNGMYWKERQLLVQTTVR